MTAMKLSTASNKIIEEGLKWNNNQSIPVTLSDNNLFKSVKLKNCLPTKRSSSTSAHQNDNSFFSIILYLRYVFQLRLSECRIETSLEGGSCPHTQNRWKSTLKNAEKYPKLQIFQTVIGSHDWMVVLRKVFHRHCGPVSKSIGKRLVV